MIAFTVSVIPINQEVFQVDLSQYFQSETLEEPVPEVVEVQTYKLALDGDAFFYGNKEVSFTVESNQTITAPQIIMDSMNVKFRDRLNNQTTVALNDLTSVKNTVNDTKMSISFSTDDFDLGVGAYAFEVYSSNENFEVKSAVFEIALVTDKTYVWSNNIDAPVGQYYRILYFLSDDQEYLIPTSTIVKDNGNLTRDLFNALYAGPKENIGLTAGSPIPYSMNIFNSNATSYYSITNTEATTYMENRESAIDMIAPLLNTMTQLSFIDNIVIDQPANLLTGVVNGELYQVEAVPTAYVGYLSSTEYAYLAPTPLQGVSYEDMYAALRGDESKAKYSSNATAVIPINVELLSATLTEGVLTLDLSSEFANAHGKDTNMINMMFDSMIYSFKSFEGVEKVSFSVDGEQPTDFFGYDLTREFTGNKNMNLQP